MADKFLTSSYAQTDTQCPHWSWTGDEGPAILLGREVRRWKCDSCGAIRQDCPKCGKAMSVLDVGGGLEIVNEAIYQGNEILSCKPCADRDGLGYFS